MLRSSPGHSVGRSGRPHRLRPRRIRQPSRRQSPHRERRPRRHHRHPRRRFARSSPLPAFGGAIFSLTTHALPDGVLLAAGTHSRVVRLYKLNDDAEPLELWTSRQHTGWVRALTFATRRSAATRPDRLVSIGCNRLLSWGLDASQDDAREPEIEHALYEDEICVRSHDIFSLAHGGAAEALAAGSVDGALRRWSTASETGVAASLRDRAPLHWTAATAA